jgi:LPS-assembly lipoprotein
MSKPGVSKPGVSKPEMSKLGVIGRRRVLPLALSLLASPLLGSCGFHPIYARRDDGADGPAAGGMAQIAVALMPERPGQLLRLALQERFERSGTGVARRYDLRVSFVIAAESIAVQQDSSSSRIRFVGQAQYRLTAQDPTRTTLTSGSARVVDGLNVFDQQYFAADQETEVVQRRIAEAVADQIALQLALYFNKQAAAGAAG